jgi:hypothetical protein
MLCERPPCLPASLSKLTAFPPPSGPCHAQVERLVGEVLSSPVRISVGQTGAANEDVTQYVEVLEGGDGAKRAWLMGRLQVRRRTAGARACSPPRAAQAQRPWGAPACAAGWDGGPLTPPPAPPPSSLRVLWTTATCSCLPGSAPRWRSW